MTAEGPRDDVICPATMCPYMGADDGSEWSGEHESSCESSCGWWEADYGGCVAGTDLSAMASEKLADIEYDETDIPPCQWESRCQWEQQGGDMPCPPRALMIAGESPTGALF